MYVYINGLNISQSPFPVLINSSYISSSTTSVSGKGLFSATAGIFSSFLIDATDNYGNPTIFNSSSISATLYGPQTYAAIIYNISFGIFEARYNVTAVGKYNLTVLVNGSLISAGNFTVVVAEATIDSSTSFLFGQGLKIGEAGVLSPTFIQSADFWNNNLTYGEVFHKINLITY